MITKLYLNGILIQFFYYVLLIYNMASEQGQGQVQAQMKRRIRDPVTGNVIYVTSDECHEIIRKRNEAARVAEAAKEAAEEAAYKSGTMTPPPGGGSRKKRNTRNKKSKKGKRKGNKKTKGRTRKSRR